MDKKRGRPRNTEAKNAILNASYDLLLEMGFGAVTVEKIAEQAQVSKATIYKWWPNKAAVVMDGYLFAASARLPLPDTGSVKEDILIHAGTLAQFLTSREGKVITELIGEGQFDAGLADAYRSRYFGPRRQEAWKLLERGIAKGELKQELDIGSCIDLIYGPIFYRLLLTGDELSEASVRSLVLLAFEGIEA
ncbi:TetR/AcrR family transcriptional regulator [Paenibacillus tritici]|jgi:AcrR family transcriptional regulator|uniref:TetR/AcrR family transcriptional regulator n=1 Tax=Paenibacillus tritici TaxID=1873425 RepID=A0ABX2DUS5_9BACL|nr:TetR/AcrR family transcriptional regulator [Paenibacillus tritici]NQX47309.1 TetR/AcrR family transcriptional regulator [Paenibacillus tritici]QUL56018.1 TetR/AcrR family transcriptional regulator [Paenibacillus tritici]